jgi:predicted amidohydrolase YtcJ
MNEQSGMFSGGTNMLGKSLVISITLTAAAGMAQAQTADSILVNGKILTVDRNNSIVQALAIRDGRILATGSNEEVRKRADQNTKVIDLGGRTVTPGLIDSHIHALRAGLTYSVELSWIGVPSLAQGLNLIREAARNSRPGTWIKVGGGWTELQFPEKRGPTVEELAAAAPDYPVYVQRLYNTAWVTPAGIKAMNLTADTQIPTGKAEKDAAGNLTGVFTGGNAAFNFLSEKIPAPTFQDQVEGSKRYFRELNRLGMTGVHDVIGGGMFPVHYRPSQVLWKNKELSIRLAFRYQTQQRGNELQTFQDYVKFTPQGFGDDMMRFVGLGESITPAMFDGSTVGLIFSPSDKDKDDYYKVVRWAAEQGLSVHQHASTNNAASMLLDIYERVNREVPISNLRWQITHIEDATEQTLQRMKALNMGWSVQDRLLYNGQVFLKVLGADAARRAPPIKTGLKMGLMVAAGTDSDQVAPYNPFVSLRWLLDGKAIDGTQLRGPEETPNREEALRMYTLSAAWFSFDDDKRGSLEPGKLADLAVLSGDYLTVPLDKVGELHSVLTLVGGNPVYAEGPFVQ